MNIEPEFIIHTTHLITVHKKCKIYISITKYIIKSIEIIA